MGQSNSPVSSRLGYSMYWNSMWDSKLLYTRKLKEDFFFNLIFYQLLNSQSILNKNMFKIEKNHNNSFIIFFKKYIPNYLVDGFQINNIIEEFNPKKTFYTGKFWILRYQNWLILSFFIYSPYSLKRKTIKNNKQFIRKLKYKNLFKYFRRKIKKKIFINDLIFWFNFNEKLKFKSLN